MFVEVICNNDNLCQSSLSLLLNTCPLQRYICPWFYCSCNETKTNFSTQKSFLFRNFSPGNLARHTDQATSAIKLKERRRNTKFHMLDWKFVISKHRKNCECCHHHSLFKGHNVNVTTVVLNCQKCNQCHKCQVSGFLNVMKIFQKSKIFPKI